MDELSDSGFAFADERMDPWAGLSNWRWDGGLQTHVGRSKCDRGESILSPELDIAAVRRANRATECVFDGNGA